MTAVGLDPFQDIVNVSWGGKSFAVLEFISNWNSAPVANTNDFQISLSDSLGAVHVYDNLPNLVRLGLLLVTGTAPYHTEVNNSQTPSGGSIFYQQFNATWDPGSAAFGQWVATQTINGVSTYFEVHGSAPNAFFPTSGGIIGTVSAADVITQNIVAGGGSNVAITFIGSDGPYSVNNGGFDQIDQVDHAIILFDLKAIRSQLPAGTTSVDISFATGSGPSTVHDPDHLGIIGYEWTARLRTARVGVDSFKAGPTNLLVAPFPTFIGGAEVDSELVQPTPSKAVRFTVDLDTLAVST